MVLEKENYLVEMTDDKLALLLDYYLVVETDEITVDMKVSWMVN